MVGTDDLFCNEFFTSPGLNKSRFYVKPYKSHKNVTVSMSKFAIPNIDIKFCTQKGEFLQGNSLRSLIQTKITRQRPFKLIDTEHD